MKKKEQPGLPKQKPTKTVTNITDDIVNTHIKENLETVTNHLRNERVKNTKEANECKVIFEQCI